MSDILKVLNDSGVLAVIGAIFTAVIIPALKQAHATAKNAKIASTYTVLDKLAEGAVALMSTEYEKTSAAKHDQAIATIQSQLGKQGIKNLDTKDIDLAIEKAYQYFTSTNTKSQAKQAEFDAGVAEADKVSSKVVPETANVDIEPATSNETDDDELTQLRTADAKLQARIKEIEGGVNA